MEVTAGLDLGNDQVAKKAAIKIRHRFITRCFGAEMLHLFKDQWRDVQSGKSALRRVRFWLWLCADTERCRLN